MFAESRASIGEFRAEEQSSADSEPESSELGLLSPSPGAELIRVETILPSSAQIYAALSEQLRISVYLCFFLSIHEHLVV